MSREVMEISLEALLLTVEEMRSLYGSAIEQEDAIEALRATLAQPGPDTETEPVAWMYVNADDECEQIEYGKPFDDPDVTPLYTAPPQRKPLTNEQIEGLFFDMGQYAKVDLKAFARAIEAAHGIRKEK